MEEYPQRVRQITALKETKRGRMAVFFDGEFDFSVDDETLLRHDLKVGKRLDERAYGAAAGADPVPEGQGEGLLAALPPRLRQRAAAAKAGRGFSSRLHRPGDGSAAPSWG